MSALPRVVKVDYLGEHRLRLTFTDGLVRELDLALVVASGGVFEPLADPSYFAQVGIDQIAGTICWPNGVDLDPNVLHGDHEPATGPSARVTAERRLRTTA